MSYKKEFFTIIIIKVLFTFFTLYVYNHFSYLADSDRYLNAALKFNNLLDRTQFVDNIFATLRYVISSKLLVNFFISIIFGCAFFYIFKDLLKYIDRKLLYISFLLPSFQIWTSIAGKEIIAIIGLLFLVKWIINIQFGRKNSIIYLLIGLVFGVLIRPHYGIAYIYLAVSVIVWKRIKISPISKGAYISLLIVTLIIVTLIITITTDVWSETFLATLRIIKNYFLSYGVSNANRYYIQWEVISDYFNNIFFGLVVSIIGPTLDETINRSIYLPFFIEGVVSFILMIVVFYRLYKTSEQYVFYRKFLYLSFIPAVVIVLMIHYPFGIFNPGAAIRYKQNITPLIYFYPLLVLACINESKAKHNII